LNFEDTQLNVVEVAEQTGAPEKRRKTKGERGVIIISLPVNEIAPQKRTRLVFSFFRLALAFKIFLHDYLSRLPILIS